MFKGTNRKLLAKETSGRRDSWGPWGVVLAGASILVAIVLAIRAENLQRQLASRSGSLDKPTPTLSVGGIKVDQSLTIYYAAPFTQHSITVADIPLEVRNDGGKTMNGPQIVVREPKIAAIDTGHLKASAESILPVNLNVERHFAVLGKFAYSSFSAPNLNPGQTLGIQEPLVIENSNVKFDLKAHLKDGNQVSYIASLEFGYPVMVSTSGEDLKTTDYELEIIGLQATNEAEMMHALKDAIKGKIETANRERGFWSRISGYFSPIHVRALLIMPRFNKQSQPGGGTVYLPVGIQFNRTVEYDAR